RAPGRPLKEHVLHEVRGADRLGPLVARAATDADAHGDDFAARPLPHDRAQAVRQHRPIHVWLVAGSASRAHTSSKGDGGDHAADGQPAQPAVHGACSDRPGRATTTVKRAGSRYVWATRWTSAGVTARSAAVWISRDGSPNTVSRVIVVASDPLVSSDTTVAPI